MERRQIRSLVPDDRFIMRSRRALGNSRSPAAETPLYSVTLKHDPRKLSAILQTNVLV
jgi:hypothetical protein